MAPISKAAAPYNWSLANARPVGVFQGYNQVTGTAKSTAVTGPIQNTNGYSTVKCQVCMGIKEVSDVLALDQSLTASYASIASVDEKLQFLQSQKLTTLSTSILVYAKHVAGTQTMTDVAPRPGVSPPAKDDPAALTDFLNFYGDCFLSSRTLGGEYFASYSFYSETAEQQEKLALDLKAQGLIGPVSVDASLSFKIDKVKSSQQSRMTLQQYISGIENPSLPSPNNIVQFAMSFPSLPLTSPSIIRFDTAGYETVPGLGGYASFGPLVRIRNRFAGKEFQASLVMLQHLKHDIASIKDTYAFYGGFNDIQLTNVEKQVVADENAVKKAVQAYSSGTESISSITIPELGSVSQGSPSLSALMLSEKPQTSCTGRGGHPFADVTKDDLMRYMQQRMRMSSIQMASSGRVVYYLKVKYTFNSGKGSEVKVVTHGSTCYLDLMDELNVKTTRELILVPPCVFVKSAAGSRAAVNVTPHGPGSYEDIVKRVCITLTNSDSISAGERTGIETAFDAAVPLGSFAVGFSGKCQRFLNELHLLYATFSPATWVRPQTLLAQRSRIYTLVGRN